MDDEPISEEDIGRVCLYHAVKLGILPTWAKGSDVPAIMMLTGWTQDKTNAVMKEAIALGFITTDIGPNTSRN